MGRLAPGTRLEVARDRAGALGQRLAESYPETNRGVAATLAPLSDPSIRMSPETTRLLLSAGALVLLLACSNVALLLLARGVDRTREIGVRRSVGASRGALVGQLLAESLGLALAGAALGVGVAVWVLEAIERSTPAELLGSITFGLDVGVLAWVALLTMGAGLLFGLGPAAVGAGLDDPHGRVRTTPGVGAMRTAGIVRGVVGALRVGLATVLIIGAGGLLRSLQEATGDALGFEPDEVLAVQLEMGSSSPFGWTVHRGETVALVTERLGAVPGVFSVAATASLPFEETAVAAKVLIRGDNDSHETLSETVFVRAVSPAYFYTMRQRLSDGRWFRADDDDAAAAVAIVSVTAGRRLFADPPRSPLGAEIALDVDLRSGEGGVLGEEAPGWRTVVGVVRDEWAESELRSAEAVVYVPIGHAMPDRLHFVARVDGRPADFAGEVREVLSDIDPAWQTAEVVPLGDRVRQAYAGERFGALLATTFAGLALAISLVGLFGVLSHVVATRVREWGLRRAVGATEGEIRGSILARGATVALVGVALGGAGAALFAEGLDAVFSGVGLRTPLVYAGALTLLAGLVVAVSAWPARQTVAVDVVSALRAE